MPRDLRFPKVPVSGHEFLVMAVTFAHASLATDCLPAFLCLTLSRRDVAESALPDSPQPLPHRTRRCQ